MVEGPRATWQHYVWCGGGGGTVLGYRGHKVPEQLRKTKGLKYEKIQTDFRSRQDKTRGPKGHMAALLEEGGAQI